MLLVAEIGLNHDGNFDLAYELIRQASDAGADIAKFQLGWRCEPDEINCIDVDLATQLKRWCDWVEVEFMASVITEEAFDIARAVDPDRYKIASRTVVENPQLVETILGEDKETFISLGWWEQNDWPFGQPTDRMRYIFCRSNYPTYPRQLRGMPDQFGDDGYYGYSDHMHGIEGCLLAISRGAQFIEKHFTLDKTIQGVHGDHVLSATPDEFDRLERVGRPLGRLAQAVNGRREAPGGVP